MAPDPAPGTDHRALGVEGRDQVGVGHDAGVDEHVAQPGSLHVRSGGLGVPVMGDAGALEEGPACVAVGAEELLGHLERIGRSGARLQCWAVPVPPGDSLRSPSSWTRSSMSSSS